MTDGTGPDGSILSLIRNLIIWIATLIFSALRVVWAIIRGLVMITVTFFLGLIGVNIKAAIIESVMKDKDDR